MDGLRPPGLEHRVTLVPTLRGFSELLQPLARLLPLLFMLSLLAGLLLRFVAAEADPAGLMAVVGLLCWLLGHVLAQPLQAMLLRMDRHRRRPVHRLATRARLMLATLLAAIALSLSLLPVHFAYDQAQDLFTVQTLNVEQLIFRSGYLLLLLHIAAAPAYLLLSAGLLRLLRLILPAHAAAMCWLATGVLLVIIPAALNMLTILPLSLGQLSGWILEYMYANKQLAQPYMEMLVSPVYSRVIAVWLAGLGLLWLGMLPVARPLVAVRPLWLACCAALLAAGMRAAVLTQRWTAEVLPLSPVDWWSILLSGCLAMWLVWLLLCCTEDPQRLAYSWRRDRPWLVLSCFALLAMSIPCLIAGDVARLPVAAGLLLLLPALLLGLLLPLQAARLGNPLLRSAALLLLAALFLLPLPSESLILAMLRDMRGGFSLPLPQTEQLRVWLCMVAVLLLAWPGLLSRLLGSLPLRGFSPGR